MSRRRQLAPHLERAQIAGVDTLVAAFTHPSAWRVYRWADLTNVPYLYETVVPTIKAAHQMVMERGFQISAFIGPQRRPRVIGGQPPG